MSQNPQSGRSARTQSGQSCITQRGLQHGASLLFGAIVGGSASVIMGVVLGLGFGLLTGLDVESEISPAAPGAAMRTSARNGVLGGLMFGLVFWLAWDVGYLVTQPALHSVLRSLGYTIPSLPGSRRGGWPRPLATPCCSVQAAGPADPFRNHPVSVLQPIGPVVTRCSLHDGYAG